MNSVPKRVFVALSIVGLLVLACGTPQVEPEEPAQKHAFQGAQMRAVMLELRGLSLDQVTQELDPETERRKAIAKVAKVAGKIADSADAIPAVLVGGELSVEERQEFINLAQALETDARTLQSEATSLTWPQLRERVRNLGGYCTQCHDRFRQLPNVEPDPIERLR